MTSDELPPLLITRHSPLVTFSGHHLHRRIAPRTFARAVDAAHAHPEFAPTHVTRQRRFAIRERVRRYPTRRRERIGTRLHLERLRAAQRIPVRIQRARVIARRQRKIQHLTGHSLRRARRAHRNARAQNHGLVAVRRQVHVADFLHRDGDHRGDGDVLIRRCLLGGRRRVIRRRKLGLRVGDGRAERRERDRQRREICVARERRLDIAARLNGVAIRHAAEGEFYFCHMLFRGDWQRRQVVVKRAAIVSQSRRVVVGHGVLPGFNVRCDCARRCHPPDFLDRENSFRRIENHFRRLGHSVRRLENPV